MSIVTFRDVHKAFGPEVVFDSLNLQLHRKEKVGMVGPNGAGKSTILRLIIGQLVPDKGQVSKTKGLRIGYLPQEPILDGELTVLEQMEAGLEHTLKIQQKLHKSAEQMSSLSGPALKAKMREYDKLLHQFETAGGYEYQTQIKTTLAAVGFEQDSFQTKTSKLSGGQISRLALAGILMQESDLLLLDEPTNHLDLQATVWLERFLINFNGAAVLISHDRYLLDKIAGKIIEVQAGQTKVWNGNYSNFIQTKQTVELNRKRQYEQRVEFVERTVDFIARNKDQEGMRGTARGRKKRLKRLLKQQPDFLDRPVERKTVNFGFGKPGSRSELVLRCEGLTKSFDKLKLFENLSFDILSGERFGITGPNGSGKSTFLKMAMGQSILRSPLGAKDEIEPTAGTIRLGQNLKVGYLDQHARILDGEKTVLEEAASANQQLTPEQVRSRLGAFLFSGEEVNKKCGQLSGGQQSRLMLCRLVLSSPDVLVLDEPTNHLDIDSRETLEQALLQYEGTIIVVSHDRFLLDRIADRLLIMGVDELGRRCQGKTEFAAVKPVYSYYATTLAQRQQQQKSIQDEQSKVKKRKSETMRTKQGRKTPEELKRFNKYPVEQIEQMITELEEKVSRLKEKFGDEIIYKNPVLLTQLKKEYQTVNDELKLLYRAYEWRTEK